MTLENPDLGLILLIVLSTIILLQSAFIIVVVLQVSKRLEELQAKSADMAVKLGEALETADQTLDLCIDDLGDEVIFGFRAALAGQFVRVLTDLEEGLRRSKGFGQPLCWQRTSRRDRPVELAGVQQRLELG